MSINDLSTAVVRHLTEAPRHATDTLTLSASEQDALTTWLAQPDAARATPQLAESLFWFETQTSD